MKIYWDKIPEGYNWVAKSSGSSGQWSCYDCKPFEASVGIHQWAYVNYAGREIRLDPSVVEGNCDWRDSLIHRPEGM